MGIFLIFAVFQAYGDVSKNNTVLSDEELTTPLTDEEFEQASEAVRRPLDGEEHPSLEELAEEEEEEEEELVEEEEFNAFDHPEHLTELTGEELAADTSSAESDEHGNNTALVESDMETELGEEEFESASDDSLPDTPEEFIETTKDE